MNNENLTDLLKGVKTPCYVIDEAKLIMNLQLLNSIEKRTGCHILLAQKCFSAFCTYPLINQYISGATASGLFEAKLAHEEMHAENHIFSPAYLDSEIDEILAICDHIIFNSFTQWEHFKNKVFASGVSAGLRVNPQLSTQSTPIYDPCASGSRLGIRRDSFNNKSLDGIEGLHFHTLCEQNSDALEATLDAFEEKFGDFLPQMKWVNFGGGHHITRHDYDVELLVNCINRIQQKYNLTVYLEPGEAVALNAGYLVASVLDIVENDIQIAILDASAACHMPDVLEMPYRPHIIGSDNFAALPHSYRFGGNTCLAGDIIGDYSFPAPLQIGDSLIFTDMAIYSMVKNNTFNGVPLPSIYLLHADNSLELVKSFSYSDFKQRLS